MTHSTLRRSPLGAATFLVLVALWAGVAGAQGAQRSYAGTVAAPAFPEGLAWLNVPAPLTLEELQGKVVLLDFWTYGCINCLHVIPELKALEEKYADELVVIGVHSGKFDNERDTEQIAEVVRRYEVEHPVVNDADFLIWRQYGVQAWPSFMLLDPRGKVVGRHSGEGIYELFDEVIGSLVAEFDAAGLIDRRALDIGPDERVLATPLRFPGKVLADEAGGRLFIADSNHNRIVLTDLDGQVLEVVGGVDAGLVDGTFEEARFFRPQGMTLLDADTLVVADTENHALRRIDLEARTVVTVAGTGEQRFVPVYDGPAAGAVLNSPWDVLALGGDVYIAMAGQHQLWRYQPASGKLSVYAGSAREELRDGPLLEAGLNQPSGLASDGRRLLVADSEASAVRTADLNFGGRLQTVLGTGLFDFGDVDGVGDAVRLQHPLGLAFADGVLYVADTYNHKIKRVDLAGRESRTLAGSGDDGWRDGASSDARFDEPGGLSVAAGRLYVADTNNHAIRVVEPATGEVVTLQLTDPLSLLAPEVTGGPRVVRLPDQRLKPGATTLVLRIELPENHRLNALAPLSVRWEAGEGVRLPEGDLQLVEPELPISVPLVVEADAGESLFAADLTVYFCSYDAVELCLIDQVRLELAVDGSPDGADGLVLDYAVPVPDLGL